MHSNTLALRGVEIGALRDDALNRAPPELLRCAKSPLVARPP